MLDDIRNHDAFPSAEEADWIGADAVGLIVRAMALAGLALAVGVSVSLVVEADLAPPPPAVAAATR